MAAVLSVAATGLGHVYAGAPGRGGVAWCARRAADAALLWLAVTLPGRTGLSLQLLGTALVVAMVAADAAAAARRAPPARPLRWYNRGIVYVGLWSAAVAAWLPWHMLLGTTVADHLRVATDAMAPIVITGDRVYVVPRRSPPIARGDIVVYRLWGTRYLKRVVALPGDTVAMRGGTLWLSGRPVVEPYASHAREHEIGDREFAWQQAYVPDGRRSGYTPTLATWGPLVVPPDAYLVLGDNRGESMDSRYRGFVADSAVIGRPVSIFFSRDPVSGQLRWRRIGLAVAQTPSSTR